MQELPEGGGRCVKGHLEWVPTLNSEERRGRIKPVWRPGWEAWRAVVRIGILRQVPWPYWNKYCKIGRYLGFVTLGWNRPGDCMAFWK